MDTQRREELRNKVDELFGYNEHDNCGEECGEKTYRAERVNVLVDLIEREKAQAAVEALEKVRLRYLDIGSINEFIQATPTYNDAVDANNEHIDHLITQYQDREKETQ